MPEFEKAAKALKDKNSNIILAKVDATVEKDLANEFGIRGYPSIMFFSDGNRSDYDKGRTAESILSFLDFMTGESTEESQDPVTEIINRKIDVAFVGYFRSENTELHKIFKTTADSMRLYGKFFVNFGKSEEQIVVRRIDEDEEVFSGAVVEELKNWVQDQSFPLFGPINGENFKKYGDRNLEFVWLCSNKASFDDFKKNIRIVAKNYRTKYSFVWLDTDIYKQHAEGALMVSTYPALVIQSKNGRFILTNPEDSLKSSTKIAQFIEDVNEGKVEKSLKSEDIPETNDKAVKVVVGKTFKELVLQQSVDVMLEVYAPWCGHCKNLEPIYEEVAEKMKEFSDKVLIAKMDGTANEAPVEEFEWTGFPTLFFVRAGSKSPIKYEGERNSKAIVEFIKKNSSHKLQESSQKSEEL